MKDIHTTGYAQMKVYNYKKSGEVFEVDVTVYPVFDSICAVGINSEVAVLTHFASVMTNIRNHDNTNLLVDTGTQNVNHNNNNNHHGSSITSSSSSNVSGNQSHPNEREGSNDDDYMQTDEMGGKPNAAEDDIHLKMERQSSEKSSITTSSSSDQKNSSDQDMNFHFYDRRERAKKHTAICGILEDVSFKLFFRLS
jgi:hypothetical protein